MTEPTQVAMMTNAPSKSVLRQLALRPFARALCERSGLVCAEICGRGLTRAVAAARHELWWLTRHHPGRHDCFCEIARAVDYNHATIIHGVAAHPRSRHTAASTLGTCHPRGRSALNQPCLRLQLKKES